MTDQSVSVINGLQSSTSSKVDDDIEIICNPKELVEMTSDLQKTKKLLETAKTDLASQTIHAESLKEIVSKLEIELSKANSDLSLANAKVASLSELEASLKENLEMKSEQIARLETRVCEVEKVNSQYQSEIAEYKENLSALEAQLTKSTSDASVQLKQQEAELVNSKEIIAQIEAQLVAVYSQHTSAEEKNNLGQKTITDLKAELNKSSEEEKKLKEQNAKLNERVVSFENELHVLQELIEKMRSESEKSKKLQQSYIKPSMTQSQIQAKEKSVFSQFESLNSVLEEVESYKQQILTYEDLFKNLDIELLLNAQIPKIEERVQADSQPNKTELRQNLLREMAMQILNTLQQELKQWKVELSFAFSN